MMRLSIAGDYAVLEGAGHRFYYGYEFDTTPDDDTVWGFEYKRSGESVLRLSYAQMQAAGHCPPEDADMGELLLFGIGLWLVGEAR